MIYIVPRTCTEVPQDGERGSEQGDSLSRSLKEFRSAPAYVLLGDPGSGKSTEFESEQRALGETALLITARDFLAFDVGSHPDWRGKTLFIDGLDEVRAGSLNARTPFEEIRGRLDRLGRPRFRISRAATPIGWVTMTAGIWRPFRRLQMSTRCGLIHSLIRT